MEGGVLGRQVLDMKTRAPAFYSKTCYWYVLFILKRG
jgi:hypothetical protein